MTQPADQPEPSSLPPRRHKRVGGADEAGTGNLPQLRHGVLQTPAAGGLSQATDQPEPSPLPRRWRRRSTGGVSRRELDVFDNVHRRHRYWLWRERLTKLVAVGTATVLIVSFCLGIAWMRFSGNPDESDSPAGEDSNQAGRDQPLGLREKVLPSLVIIQLDDGRGTGFVIEKGLVVTAYHVAPKGRKATVVFHDGERAQVVGKVIPGTHN